MPWRHTCSVSKSRQRRGWRSGHPFAAGEKSRKYAPRPRKGWWSEEVDHKGFAPPLSQSVRCTTTTSTPLSKTPGTGRAPPLSPFRPSHPSFSPIRQITTKHHNPRILFKPRNIFDFPVSPLVSPSRNSVHTQFLRGSRHAEEQGKGTIFRPAMIFAPPPPFVALVTRPRSDPPLPKT